MTLSKFDSPCDLDRSALSLYDVGAGVASAAPDDDKRRTEVRPLVRAGQPRPTSKYSRCRLPAIHLKGWVELVLCSPGRSDPEFAAGYLGSKTQFQIRNWEEATKTRPGDQHTGDRRPGVRHCRRALDVLQQQSQHARRQRRSGRSEATISTAHTGRTNARTLALVVGRNR